MHQKINLLIQNFNYEINKLKQSLNLNLNSNTFENQFANSQSQFVNSQFTNFQPTNSYISTSNLNQNNSIDDIHVPSRDLKPKLPKSDNLKFYPYTKDSNYY